jgi:hypothetical protein
MFIHIYVLMDIEDKIELIANTCRELASLLRDPTRGGTVSMSSDERNAAREELHDELQICIDTLAAGAEFHNGIFDVISIANKRVHAQDKKEDK